MLLGIVKGWRCMVERIPGCGLEGVYYMGDN